MLYERLSLSVNKEKVLELAEKGREIKISKDLVKDIGQMQMYVNYYDREIKSNDENPTVGILLSTLKNKTVVKYTFT